MDIIVNFNDKWSLAIIIYCFMSALTAVPIILSILVKVKINEAKPFLLETDIFRGKDKDRLIENFERIKGTLSFWKQQASIHKRAHFYVLFWTVPSSILIPILTQSIDSSDGHSKLFVTIMSAFVTILLVMHKTLKVENNYKAFRMGESEYYDACRRLLDRPSAYGDDPDAQINRFFVEVERIRAIVRAAETDNFPIMHGVSLSNVVVQGHPPVPGLPSTPDAMESRNNTSNQSDALGAK